MKYFAKRGWHLTALPDPSPPRRRPGRTETSAAARRLLRRLCGRPMALAELCRATRQPYGTVYALVRRLSAEGLVDRARQGGRRGALVVSLTDAGREALEG